MKKILVYILVLLSICVWCLSHTLGSFVMVHANHDTMTIDSHHSMHEMASSESDCCEEVWWDCEENMHECCISPFSDSANLTGVLFKDEIESDNSNDVDYKALLHTYLLQTSTKKLNAPPLQEAQIELYTYSKTEYSHLIWIIRNNA